MTTIQKNDLIDSVVDALQFISYYHPRDFVQAIYEAYQREKSPFAKDALEQILINSRLCAEGRRPICQDTGIVTVFLRIGMDVRWNTDKGISELVNEGVRRAYTDVENPLRASIVATPLGERINTGDNTPAVIHMEVVPGNSVEVYVAAKGGGSENKAKLAMLRPHDSVSDWVIDTLPTLGAGWCPPGILGIGIGGTAEKAAVMAKQSLLAPVNIHTLIAGGPKTVLEKLRLEIYDRANATGIGAQGLGGLSTVLDVKILEYPTHASSLPVALIPNCAATRHAHFKLTGDGPDLQMPPSLDDWPVISRKSTATSHRVDLDSVSANDIQSWRIGETLLLSGTLLTGRDAAHKRISDLIESGQELPHGLSFRDRFIYYVGPVDAVKNEVVGPAGPITASRMDGYTETMLAQTGLLGMIGKAERGQAAIESIAKHKRVYLTAVGGAAYLVSRAIQKSRVVAFPELGMEAIHEFIVKDMPVTVAVDSRGESIHRTGPRKWQEHILSRAR